MLKRIHLHHWRNLRDVVIDDLGPITVFIGANATGKTNLIDALQLLRDVQIKGIERVVYQLGYQRILTDALNPQSPRTVTFDLTYDLPQLSDKPLREQTALTFHDRTLPFMFAQRLWEGEEQVLDEQREIPVRNRVAGRPVGDPDLLIHGSRISRQIGELEHHRWQFIADAFNPPNRVGESEVGDPYLVEPNGTNVLAMLDYLQQAYPELWESLLADARFLLDHVDNVRLSRRISDGIQLLVDEHGRKNTAWLASQGTRRLLGILAAIYAMWIPPHLPNNDAHDMSHITPESSALIVIDEADASLNPGILQRFVEQLRRYADAEADEPKFQFILTTHNPTFLDYFQPEEVRVMLRDEAGDVQVKRVPDDVRELLLGKYSLGEAWLMRAIGGMPE